MSAKVYLKKGRAGAAIGRHPWVFSGVIDRIDGRPSVGDAVTVHRTEDGAFIAHGLFNGESQIRVRLYSWDEAEPITDGFFVKRVESAVALRRDVLKLTDPHGANRVIYSEADELSGLTVDRYGTYYVAQITSAALHKHLDAIIQALKSSLKPKGIWLRTSADAMKKEGFEIQDQALAGDIPSEPIVIVENGLRMEVHLNGGQKTGLFLDQRENHRVAAGFSNGKDVLDLYSYTGGFGLACARAGAKGVTLVDSSEWAVEQVVKNAALNGLKNTEAICGDVLDVLKTKAAGTYSMVIVDPPRLAASKDNQDRALRMYFRINLEAMRVLAPKGIFVTSSCSGRVTWSDWISLLSSVGRKAHRPFQILESRGAGPDHPVSPYCPESQYLKCVIAELG